MLTTVLSRLCLAGMAASAGYYVACLIATTRFFRRARPPASPERPGISLLKPVKGVDDEAYDNFASFCRQDYPGSSYQILFGVNAADDPVVPLVRKLQGDFPGQDIELVVAERELGPNGKVSSLVQLADRARYDLLAISDGDMRVGPDYLRYLAEPFSDSRVGLVTCPYRGSEPRNLPAALLALGINAEFVPSVLLALQLEGLSFALGATMVIRRPALEAIGGFSSLVHYLADDYLLGHRTHRAGYRLALVPYLVDHVIRRETFADYWSHQLRWARTYRACRPVGYFFSVITHGPLYAVGYLCLSAFSPLGWALLGTTLGIRMLTAGIVATSCLRATGIWNYLWLLPLRDLLGSLLWALAFLGNRVSWRGQTYRLGPEGTLHID